MNRNQPHSTITRNRRIGRKVLFVHRIDRTINPRRSSTFESFKSLLRAHRKTLAISLAALVLIAGFGYTGVRLHNDRLAAAEKVAATERQARLRVQSAQADACRQEKVRQKADLIGKVTYDELYDGDECDK